MIKNWIEVVLLVVVVATIYGVYLDRGNDMVVNQELEALQVINQELVAAQEQEFYRGVYATCLALSRAKHVPSVTAVPGCLKFKLTAESVDAYHETFEGLDNSPLPQSQPIPKATPTSALKRDGTNAYDLGKP